MAKKTINSFDYLKCFYKYQSISYKQIPEAGLQYRVYIIW